MPYKYRIKYLLNIFGTILGGFGVLFVSIKIYEYSNQISIDEFDIFDLITLIVFSVVSISLNVLLTLGWREILLHSNNRICFDTAVSIYARSQLAKYVPGNIFHLVGRQALGAVAGIASRPLAMSTIWELGIIATCALLFLPLLLPTILPSADPIESLTAFILLSIMAHFGTRKLLGSALMRSAIYYFAYLCLTGVIFAAIYVFSGGLLEGTQLAYVAGAYVLAWLAGLLTPGAPAGLGVREAVLLFLLSGIGSPSTILLATVLGRTVTVLGDLGFYFIGGYFGRNASNNS